jgi:hypothetical protein
MALPKRKAARKVTKTIDGRKKVCNMKRNKNGSFSLLGCVDKPKPKPKSKK